jgi:AcrR family transcriptional regulator
LSERADHEARARHTSRPDRQADRRRRVLDGLVELFLREGFADFTLDDLARRLRCSKSTLYLVETSKEQLVAATVRRFFQRATKAVEEHVAATTRAAAGAGVRDTEHRDDVTEHRDDVTEHRDDVTEHRDDEHRAHGTAQSAPDVRLSAYLEAVANELQTAAPAFFADVAAHPPARAIYETNTRLAARRVQDLVLEGVRAGRMRDLDAAFVGAAVEQVMTAIHRGDIAASTGLGDADAYRELARLVSAALATGK